MVRLETVSYSHVPTENNEVLLNFDAPTTMIVSFMLSKPVQEPWGSLPVKGEIRLFYIKDNQEIDLLHPNLTFSSSDWSLPTFSNFIGTGLHIGANTVTLENPKIGVIAQWRYYKEGYPHPDNNNGWTNWYNVGATNFVLNKNTLPQTSFDGPGSICNEGTYTVYNPGAMSLENASGIATLTNLGNNKYKITKTNSVGGIVVLKSQKGPYSSSKNITIEPSYLDGIINGPVMIKPTDTDLKFVFEPSNNQVEASQLNWYTNNPYVKLTKVNETTAILSFLPGFNIPSDQTNLNLEITASKSNSCGLISTSTIVKVRK